MLIPGAQHSDSIFLQNVSYGKSSVTIQRYYSITEYIPHVVYFILMTHLYCNWKSVPLTLHLLHSTYHLRQSPFLLCLCCFPFFICCFLDSIYKLKSLHFSFWLISLSAITSRTFHAVTLKSQKIFLFTANISLHIIYHIFIHSPIAGHSGGFHMLPIVNAAINIGVHTSFLIGVFFFLWKKYAKWNC